MRLSMPFCARSVCHGKFEPGEFEDRHVRSFAKVLWGVSGTGMVLIGSRFHALPPDHIAVLLPTTRHEARAGDEPWEARWFTLDGPLVCEMMNGFGYVHNAVYPAPRAPVDVFGRLEEALHDTTPQAEARASAIAYELLGITVSRAPADRHDLPRLVARALSLIEQQWADPALNVESLAQRLSVSRSRLSRMFSTEIGIGPGEHLTNARLRHAIALLSNTEKSVRDIARLCGYTDPNYFIRLFRKRQGLAPNRWREAHG